MATAGNTRPASCADSTHSRPAGGGDDKADEATADQDYSEPDGNQIKICWFVFFKIQRFQQMSHFLKLFSQCLEKGG